MTYRRFEDVMDRMPRYLQELEDCQIITRDGRGRLSHNLPARGIYVFYENGEPKYVGRSDRLKDRLLEHGRASGGPGNAHFAFNVAKKEFRKTHPYCAPRPRKDLAEEPEFASLFSEAKRRVRRMGIRVVEIQDPIEQTIFEVYAHLKLGTPFNSFENH